MIYTHDYVREDEASKVRPVAKNMPAGTLIIAFLFTAIPLIAWSAYTQKPWFSLLLIPMYVVKTERGRWSYTSDSFYLSSSVLTHSSRASQAQSVTLSLQGGQGHTADQARVWADAD